MSTSSAIPTHEEIEARVDNWLDGTRRHGVNIFGAFRGLAFFIYLIFAFLSFWLWIGGAIFFIIRAIPFFIGRIMLVLADGVPEVLDEPGLPLGERLQRHSSRAWGRRDLVYERYSTPFARSYIATRDATQRFMHWHFGRKLMFLTVAVFLFGIPMMYIIPRPIYVQLIDDNAINVDSEGVTRYLVHGVGIYNHKTYEMRNDPNWLFLKFNPQGLQNRLQVGRYYRLWVIGIRWWVPQIFPNVLWATEIDSTGKPIKNPVPFITPTAPGGTYPKTGV